MFKTVTGLPHFNASFWFRSVHCVGSSCEHGHTLPRSGKLYILLVQRLLTPVSDKLYILLVQSLLTSVSGKLYIFLVQSLLTPVSGKLYNYTPCTELAHVCLTSSKLKAPM